jgi:citrate synthase
MRTIGIPVSMFTPIFAVARTVGWIAHWIEMLTDPEAKLVRPRQLYIGARERGYIVEADRSEHRPTVG